MRTRRAAVLDWDNLAEEIEGLAKSERRALRSYLQNALLHLLYLVYRHSEPERSQWRDHLDNAREGIEWLLEDSQSLHSYLDDVFARTYAGARRRAAAWCSQELPALCPWTLAQVLDHAFSKPISPR